MKILALDVETTILENGHPFHPENKLCYVGVQLGDIYSDFSIEYDSEPYGRSLVEIQSLIDEADVLVLFNAKFDLHWIRRYGINFSNKRIHDCQLVHFILTNQTTPYPSLNMVADYYGLGTKLDVVATEYWDKGIDTPLVPRELLQEYLQQDVSLTYQIYLKQIEEVASRNLQRLVSLSNQDLVVLQEMEWNGLLFNKQRSQELSTETEESLKEVTNRLSNLTPDTPINWGSGNHLSCLLYGGTIVIPFQYENGTFKSGAKAGQVKWSWDERSYVLPRLVEPLKGSELKKEGYWSTDEPTLRSLKAKGLAKLIIQEILEWSRLEKLNGTYYKGLISLCEKKGWTDNIIHGQLNQCVAQTGRLSASVPNQQNLSSDCKELFITRY